MQIHTVTLSFPASRKMVFNFFADIENLPAWTGGFCEWIELRRDGWWAFTSLGELEVETKVDDIAAEIDLGLRHVSGWKIVIPLRVKSDGADGSLVSVVCRQAAGMADADHERLFEALVVGLRSRVVLMADLALADVR